MTLSVRHVKFITFTGCYINIDLPFHLGIWLSVSNIHISKVNSAFVITNDNLSKDFVHVILFKTSRHKLYLINPSLGHDSSPSRQSLPACACHLQSLFQGFPKLETSVEYKYSQIVHIINIVHLVLACIALFSSFISLYYLEHYILLKEIYYSNNISCISFKDDFFSKCRFLKLRNYLDFHLINCKATHIISRF